MLFRGEKFSQINYLPAICAVASREKTLPNEALGQRTESALLDGSTAQPA
jgi:hypothetical protein